MDVDLLPILVHIQTGLDTDLGSAALARHTGWSESTLHRRMLKATGETPRVHVERLRLERAAAQLVLRQSTILDVALDNGFASHEVFTRAFHRHFGLSPREWRERRSAGGLGAHDRQPGLSEGTYGVSLSNTRLTELRPVEIAFLRHVGPYDQVDGDTWSRIRDRLRELGHSSDGLPVGIGHDAPDITPPHRLRFDVGWTIDEPLPAACGLGQQTIAGGTYAMTTYVGPFALIGQAYAVIAERLMSHADTLTMGIGDFRGSVEWYRTGSIDEETYLNQIDISFPVTARARGPWSRSEPRVLETILTPEAQEDDMPDFEIRQVAAQHIAAIRISSPMEEIGTSMGQAFPKIFETVTKAGAVPAGPPLARYFTFGGPIIEYECAIPVTAPFAGDGDVQPDTIDGGEAAFTLHVGPYEGIGETWGALMAWLGKQGRQPAGPGWESYIDDPGEVDASQLRTEVYMPVA